MAWVQADLDALNDALADGKGARVIQFSDQRIEFHSMDDMLKLRSMMKREIEGTDTQRHRYAVVGKGT